MSDIFYNFNQEIMKDFNWFLYKINQRACINLGFIKEEYVEENRFGKLDYGLGRDVEYFHPSITLDDRMRYIGTVIANQKISLFNIVCNTLISHFYGARGVHQALTDSKDPNNCFIDFDQIADNNIDYIRLLQKNVEKSKRLKIPIWGTTELHTSIQTAARNYCRTKYSNNDRLFNVIDVCEWVASFRDSGIFDKLVKCEHIKDAYTVFKSLPGIGDYYGFHGAASTSALPQLKYHHDQKFVAPGPGAVYALKLLYDSLDSKKYADAVYFLREKSDEIGLTENIIFHPSSYNIKLNCGNNLFEHNQDSLKYYGTEVLCCQFGIYLQIRNDKKMCEKRKVARIKTNNIRSLWTK